MFNACVIQNEDGKFYYRSLNLDTPFKRCWVKNLELANFFSTESRAKREMKFYKIDQEKCRIRRVQYRLCGEQLK
jgi:hypothetical protein